jgi:type II secretory pathway component PulF
MDCRDNSKRQSFFMAFSSKNLALFYSQLATLIDAGVPVQQALESMSKSAPKSLIPTVLSVKKRVCEGEPIHEALAFHEKLFSPLDLHLITITNQSGALDVGLRSLSEFHERQSEARSKIYSASLLPLLVFIAAIFIVPLPKFILGVMSGGEYTALYYLRDTVGFLILLCLVIFILSQTTQILLRRPGVNLILDRLFSLVPLCGKFRSALGLSRWLQSLRLLLRAGYGVVQALEFSCRCSSLPSIEKACQKTCQAVSGGTLVSQALESTNTFPPTLIQLWATGEQSGRMDEMLDKLVEIYENEWKRNLQHLTEWLPRLIYGLVSLFILFQIFKMAMVYLKYLNDAASISF